MKTGTVAKDALEMVPGCYWVLISDDPKAHFSLQAWEGSTIALPGGSGE